MRQLFSGLYAGGCPAATHFSLAKPCKSAAIPGYARVATATNGAKAPRHQGAYGCGYAGPSDSADSYCDL